MDKARLHRETALLLMSNAIDHMLAADSDVIANKQRSGAVARRSVRNNVTRRLAPTSGIVPFRRSYNRDLS
jgi:hypothetical protein